MATSRIAVFVGSLSRESINRQLAQALIELAPADFSLRIARIDDLPVYNRDDDSNPAEPVKRLKREITESQGVLFVTPEYNRSIPASLKNVLDHASRPYGQSVWAGKPAGVVGASIGAPGASMAQQHLRNILAYLDARTLGQPEAFVQFTDDRFADDGTVRDAETRDFLTDWLTAFCEWAEHCST